MGLIPSGSTCNLLVPVLAKSKEYKMAFEVYKKMTSAGALPTYLSFSALVECLVHFGVPQVALAATGLILKHGYSVNVYVANVILRGFCSNGCAVKAEEFLGEMHRNLVTPDRGQVEEAIGLLEEMKMKGLEPDGIVYGTLINGLCSNGDVNRAKEFWKEILNKGISPDRITYSCLMRGLCQKGQLKEAKFLFNDMIKSGIRPDVVTFTGMIGGFANLGEQIKQWNCLISCWRRAKSLVLQHIIF
ncbi:UNVERIFIED_CONTAM: hypothetical protein Slati_0539800 [Sesamum latifolium]|uniref:Pentatricopeptide repeat-containing protein n=1 Tax=Sesamum latifolium TaxID=2727402 RepID=A0AAW2XZ62_9LAMI